MRALTYHGKSDMRCESVPDPKIEHPRDAIIKITSCAICGSDLHIFDGVSPSMQTGDILGHENMGEVVEVGRENKKLKVGDRVVVPFTIACGECFFCKRGFFSGCERTNSDHKKAFQAVYNGAKAFLDSFSFALRAELKDSGVTVTCLMPGATETEFLERADMMDTKVGQSKKDDAADVARCDFDAMMRGDGEVVTGWMNKLGSDIATVTPAGVLAEMHRGMAQPASERR